ncbi:hypothetical protein M422DRAFT_51280 [Sphaerobolus stellatus SS14]|uniref:Uncharacterized protein n=1 Tax=Sphaerobolus stellatus (strain SS14) TaxID=990650 RepID=A0A0C9VEX9_SPHS4|nr:hypothetical protein M422DRAFT_51280 [Sphaerobolus stellatus SS14]
MGVHARKESRRSDGIVERAVKIYAPQQAVDAETALNSLEEPEGITPNVLSRRLILAVRSNDELQALMRLKRGRFSRRERWEVESDGTGKASSSNISASIGRVWHQEN